jgi:hypothetical protein
VVLVSVASRLIVFVENTLDEGIWWPVVPGLVRRIELDRDNDSRAKIGAPPSEVAPEF